MVIQGFCRKVAFSRVWESVSHCIPDIQFLDFAQNSNFATEPFRLPGITLDVRFISSLPVMQRLACKVWADKRLVQIVWAVR
jgi:hypothetical protein